MKAANNDQLIPFIKTSNTIYKCTSVAFDKFAALKKSYIPENVTVNFE